VNKILVQSYNFRTTILSQINAKTPTKQQIAATIFTQQIRKLIASLFGLLLRLVFHRKLDFKTNKIKRNPVWEQLPGGYVVFRTLFDILLIAR
jgi:hypothetical protein